jgi:hypothetical protein
MDNRYIVFGSNAVRAPLVLLNPITRKPVISSTISDPATCPTTSRLRMPKSRWRRNSTPAPSLIAGATSCLAA